MDGQRAASISPFQHLGVVGLNEHLRQRHACHTTHAASLPVQVHHVDGHQPVEHGGGGHVVELDLLVHPAQLLFT